MTKVLFAGDWHGNYAWADKVIREAGHADVEYILQVGDFGYGWEVNGNGCAFSQLVSEWAVDAGVEVWWLDGNHENYDLMELDGLLPKDDGASDDWLWPVGYLPNLAYMHRGSRFILGETSFMAMGGAYSVDKAYRTPHQSWWEQEELTAADVERAGTTAVDFLLTHDAPAHQLVPGDHAQWKSQDAAADANREKLLEVVERVRPEILIHGHYHIRYSDTLVVDPDIGFSVEVTGLGRDGDPNSLLTLEV